MKYEVTWPGYSTGPITKERADGYLAYVQKFWAAGGPYTIKEIYENGERTDSDNKTKIPSWDEFFMRQVYLYASKSKDKSSKLGAILVKDKIILSGGYNGICRGLDDNIKERNERPTKYFYYEHSERNCLYNAARNGISTLGSVIFTNGISCIDCTRAIIQCGCTNIYTHKQWNDIQRQNKSKWAEHFSISQGMFNESRINLVELDLVLGISCLLDGKTINV